MCESGNSSSCQHLVGFPRETDLGYVLDDCQEDLVLFEFGLKVLLYKGRRTKRCPEDVNPVSIWPLGALMRGVECLLIFHRFGESTVRDVVEGEDVRVLATGVRLWEGCPTCSCKGLDIYSVLGRLGRESCLRHGKRMMFVYDLGEDCRRAAYLDVVRDG
jgi:hypothetical protein